MTMDDAFIVQGGTPLKGTAELTGAKNVALKVIIAALLLDEPVTFTNVPDLSDIHELSHLIAATGAKISFHNDEIHIDPRGMSSHEVDLLHGSKIRVSFMLFAPFMHTFRKARIPNPGGCRIGARPIDRMIDLMKSFEIVTAYDTHTGYYDAKLNGNEITGTDFTFPKKTHTGTELAVMFGAVAKGKTIIRNASLEPEIDDLILFLNQAGADIKRNGEEIHIEGVKNLHSPGTFRISSDRNNAVTYAVFGIATQGDVFVHGAKEESLKVFLDHLDRAGGGFEVMNDGIRFFYKGKLRPVDVTTAPEPGFMTDWQSPWSVLMTLAHGTSTIHETVFENRFGYASELMKLGAHIEYYQPQVADPDSVYQFDIKDVEEFRKNSHQGIRITGPSELHGGVMNVTDMRAGATLLIAACTAKGDSVVIGASEIDRGYDDIEKRLSKLGASIKRV